MFSTCRLMHNCFNCCCSTLAIHLDYEPPHIAYSLYYWSRSKKHHAVRTCSQDLQPGPVARTCSQDLHQAPNQKTQ